MTKTASTSHRTRRLARIATTWVVALLVLGFACPHCRVPSDTSEPSGVRETSAHARSSPPCHAEAPVDTDPAGPPLTDCDCAACDGLSESVPPAKAAHEPSAEVTWVAIPPHLVPDVASAMPVGRARAHWIPPPYPGFAENTVVLLN